ncbi:MAG: sigma-70 family RNA polymerase sigma factor [Bryobacteraceae bacterium]
MRRSGRSEDPPRSSQYPGPPQGSSRWTQLVDGIRGGDSTAIEELYRLFGRGIRFFLCRHLGVQDLDDRVHDTFLLVVRSIQNGGLRDPERLMGFVRTIVRRQIAAYIEEAVQSRREQAELDYGSRVADYRNDPEARILREQRVQLMLEVLRSISPRDREILTRFYLYEQTPEQICEEMGLTETQFRLLKSRAKARFGEAGRKRLASNPIARLLRRSASG